MGRNDLSLEPCHLGVPSGASKTIFWIWWYVWRKPCTYLAPTLTLSPKRKKWGHTWPTSPRSSIGCVQNDVRAYVTFDTKPFTYFVWSLALRPNRSKWAFTCASSPRSTIGCVQKDFLSWWYVWCKPCTYLAPTLTLSPTRKKWNHTWPTSPRSSIGCVQNDVWAYVTLDANRSPILCED
jgi:hypothetical protein